MINFSELKFEEFKDLVLFLKFSDDESEGFNITQRLQRFIENMSAVQSLILNNITTDILNEQYESAKTLFDSFQMTYPDTQFDPEGKLDLTKIDYFELKLQSCEVMFERAKNVIENNETVDKFELNVNSQIYNAKLLLPLLAMKGSFEYPMHRTLYFKQNPNRPITLEEFKEADKKLKDILGKNNVMGKFLNYIYNLKDDKCKFFIDHFLTRLDILSKDTELAHPANKEFKELLMKIG